MPTYASMRSRLVWLTEGDWRAFTAAVVEVFPDVRCCITKATYGEPPPVFRPKVLAKNPFELEGIYDKGVEIDDMLNPDWQPPDHYLNAAEADEAYRMKMPFFWLRPFHLFTPERQQKWKRFPYDMITFYSLPGIISTN